MALQSLFGKRVLSLDLASIVAGTGVRGQFESKFKALLKDIEEEEGKVICFIDELRTSHCYPSQPTVTHIFVFCPIPFQTPS